MNGRRILAICVLALAGCEQVKRIDDEGNGGAIPTVVQEAFDRQCNDTACHGPSPQLGLSLVAGDSASILEKNGVGNPDLPLVDIGNVPGSYLAVKLLPDGELMDLGITRVGLRMPNVPITPEIQTDVALILGWIAGAELPGGGEGGTGGTGTGSESTTAGTTGEVDKHCSIENLAPGSPPDLVEAGDGAMRIPTEIGAVLTNNCGCHYVDGTNDNVPDLYSEGPTQPMLIATWGQWHSTYMTNVEKSPIDESIGKLELDTVAAMPPPLYCDVGTGVPITEADKALLLEWLNADAPDGANWMGGGDSSGGGSTSGGSTSDATEGSSTG